MEGRFYRHPLSTWISYSTALYYHQVYGGMTDENDAFLQYRLFSDAVEDSEFYSSSLPVFKESEVQRKAFAIIYKGNKGWPYTYMTRQQRPALFYSRHDNQHYRAVQI